MIWEQRWDTQQRMVAARRRQGAQGSAQGVDVRKKLLMLWLAEQAIMRGLFQTSRTSMGLHGYHLPDMDQSPRRRRPTTTTISAAAKATWRSAS